MECNITDITPHYSKETGYESYGEIIVGSSNVWTIKTFRMAL
ncbi:hypothetical protein [Bacillus solimangrovi]|nr:hypothetical protein [Bacillus solimangrovi]